MSDRYISLNVKSCTETGGRPPVSLLGSTQIFLVFKRSYLYLCISMYEMVILLFLTFYLRTLLCGMRETVNASITLYASPHERTTLKNET